MQSPVLQFLILFGAVESVRRLVASDLVELEETIQRLSTVH